MFDATDYRSRRWRLAGDIRTEDVGLAALWMRVDAAPRPYDGSRTLAFVNMLDRAPRGTTGWSRAEIVLDVAETAGAVLFGFLLDGEGAAYLRNLTFDEIGTGVPTTEQNRLSQRTPGDLDFRHAPRLNGR